TPHCFLVAAVPEKAASKMLQLECKVNIVFVWLLLHYVGFWVYLHVHLLSAGTDAVTDTQKAPNVTQHPKPSAGHQQPLFINSFMSSSSQQPCADSRRQEMQWNPQLTPAHATLQEGKQVVQNVASQNISASRNVKLHSFRNSSAKRFGCMQCGKGFRCFSQLEIHQRSHTGEKPFRCTLCGKRYAQKGHLYTHQRTHTGEKPYRCTICGKGFIQKCTLDMHQRTHTDRLHIYCKYWLITNLPKLRKTEQIYRPINLSLASLVSAATCC
uniref:C2H2-type domain-containing protein n=1 Tax=Xiphophorus maculatus TaxID=8083 RepID=A0A3B5R0M5_XIPMA